MVLGSNVIEQFSVATVFHYHEKSLGRLDDFIKLDNTWMSYNLENMDFSFDSFDVIDIFNLPFV